ncbi:MAG: 3'-5' exonuclease [Fimbriimonadaceae bacterium]|nr:3'-5' exonuclease [Fimbriimonadaceae bacterium]
MRKVLVFDLETGGLDPRTCGITQMSAGAFGYDDEWNLAETLGQVSLLVKPVPGFEYQDQALQIQRVELERLKAEGANIGVAVNRVRDLVVREFGAEKRCAPVAHNASFDRGFLDAQLERWRIEPPFNRCWRCTMDLFRWMQDLGKHERYRANLDTIAEHYGLSLPEEERHTAGGDVRLTAMALSAMMRDLRGVA